MLFQALYTAQSAQLNFTRGLDVISNNLSNMQVTGFRGSFAEYQSVTRNGSDAGIGARIANIGISTQPGDTRETGQDFDLAIQGHGYFVLRDGDNYYYTRAGETELKDGVLVHRITQFPVQHLDENGLLQDISIEEFQFLPPQQTTRIEFDNFISSTDSIPPNSPPSTDPLGHALHQRDVDVFNAQGEKITLRVQFREKQFPTGTPPQPGVYTVTIVDKNGVSLGAFSSFDISFDPAGNVQAPTSHTFTLPSANNGTIGASMDLELDFSGLGRRAGGDSDATVKASDGRANQPLVSATFNEKGELELRYANDDTETHHRLALAFIRDEKAISAVEGGVYTTDSGNVELGLAGEGRFGTVLPRSLEASNVDMTEQFANLILQQRGFQACARVLNIASEMLEELYGRG